MAGKAAKEGSQQDWGLAGTSSLGRTAKAFEAFWIRKAVNKWWKEHMIEVHEAKLQMESFSIP